MRLGQMFFWIIVIIIAIYFISPTTFNSGKDWLFQQVGNVGKQPAPTIVYNNYSQQQEEQDTIEPPTTNISNTTNTSVITENVCLWPNKGLPDYYGTEKQGMSCKQEGIDGHTECLANTPIAYDGYIDVPSQYSDPKLKCCLEDGFCHWK